MAPVHQYPGWQDYYPDYSFSTSWGREAEFKELAEQVKLLRERIEKLEEEKCQREKPID